MLLKSIIIFGIWNYMREILNIYMRKVHVTYKTLFIEWQFIYLCHLRKLVPQ